MIASLVSLASELRTTDAKASYFIAKELTLIDLNILWYPDKIDSEISRLRSLAEHVLLTFRNSKSAIALASNIRTVATLLSIDNE